MSTPLVTASIRRQVMLERLKSGEVKRLDKYLRQADKLLRERIGATDFTRRRIEAQLRGIAADLNSIWSGFQTDLFDSLSEIGDHEAAAEVRALGTAVETTIAAPKQVLVAALAQPLSAKGYGGGKLLDSFVKDWSSRTTTRVTDVIRQGFFEGRTNDQILRTIRGTAANNYQDGLLKTITGGERALVRTAIQHMASQVREQVWAENSDIIQSVQWVATLDSATCWSAETLILMADGTQKQACDVQVGDWVIGGVTGVPCRVVDTGKREVQSSVAIHYNGRIIGRVTHDHPVLTKSGWKEIGSVSLSADVSEREVLCRSFVSPKEADERASEVFEGRIGIRTAQRDSEIRPTADGNCNGLRHTSGCVCGGDIADSRIEHKNPSRLQHDGWWGWRARSLGRVLSEAGIGAVKTIQRGCGVSAEDAGNGCHDRPTPIGFIKKVLGIRRRAGKDKGPRQFAVAEKHEGSMSSTGENSGREAAHERCYDGTLEGTRISGQSESSAGSETGRAQGEEPGMDICKSGKDERVHEREMERPRISGEDGEPESASFVGGNKIKTNGESCREATHARETKRGSGEGAVRVGEAASVTIGIITGTEDNSPVDVFNFTVAEDPSYVAGGIIVHNCDECAYLDGEEFPVGEGPRPEIHISCRCVTTPVLDDAVAVLSDNAMRSSITGPVDAKLDYYDWLKKQSDEFQDHAIGPTRAQLLRDGGLSATRFKELSLNRNFAPATLAEMKKAEPLAFERAGLK